MRSGCGGLEMPSEMCYSNIARESFLGKQVDMAPKKRLNILLADDGSQHARSAVELVENIPKQLRGRVLILRAFDSGQMSALSEIEKALEVTASQLAARGFKVEKDIQLSSPIELILTKAEVKKPDLIVMGAKGLHATIGILLGGVAQQVVEYASCPVLIMRAPYQGLRRILVVTDGSPTSQSAVRYIGGKFPLPDNADVRLLHVLPPIESPVLMEPQFGGWQTTYAGLPSSEEEKIIFAQQSKKGDALLKRTSDLLLRHGVSSTPVLERGDAATEILDYARANKIDLIVAGSRGLGQFRSWLMGSVSRKLVHYAPCSVLIVKRHEKGAKSWK
jgi:nucleotide-binding universal stress UspA family protein